MNNTAVRIVALVLCVATAPFAAEAQNAGKVYRIGVLDPTPVVPNANLDAFRQGLRELGYVDGQNLVIELKDAVPGIKRIAAVLDTSGGLATQLWRATEQSARSLGIEPHLVEITKGDELGPAFDLVVKHRAEAVVVGPGPVMQNNVGRVVDLLTKHRLPAAFHSREFVEAGGLMSYGVSYRDAYRRAATYVGKIFRGAKPADLPIEQPTEFELVINAKTAKTLGLTIPQSVLLRADDVIR